MSSGRCSTFRGLSTRRPSSSTTRLKDEWEKLHAIAQSMAAGQAGWRGGADAGGADDSPPDTL